jgi:hypothetical protein
MIDDRQQTTDDRHSHRHIWFIGTLGTLAHWHIGTLAHWLIGSLAHWLIGTLAHWLIGSLAHWHIGSLAHWLIDSSAEQFLYQLAHLLQVPQHSRNERHRARQRNDH